MTKRILIVDDEESVVFFLGENLSNLGAEYEVKTACSGEEALEKMPLPVKNCLHKLNPDAPTGWCRCLYEPVLKDLID